MFNFIFIFLIVEAVSAPNDGSNEILTLLLYSQVEYPISVCQTEPKDKTFQIKRHPLLLLFIHTVCTLIRV